MNSHKIMFICVVLSLILCNHGVFAGELMHFELSDGSVIVGKIISFKDGVYTIKSDMVGTINIKESGVRIIRKASAVKDSGNTSKQATSQINKQVEALKPQMLGDEKIRGMIFSLQSDPKFQEIMNDPAILNAINSGNIEALKSNQKFMNLINHERVRQIKKRMEEK